MKGNSMQEHSPGKNFRLAVNKEKPLQIVGVINAYCALMAARSGYRALYLSGAGVANASFGLPDLGITNLEDVLEDVRRITSVTNLPLLVDIDTGWGSSFTIARTIRQMIKAGVAAVHIEDQVDGKRCGHLSGKELVTPQEMTDRIKAAVDARTDHDFVIMARTDAFATEGLQGAIDRANQYIEAGADMIFPEALTELAQYRQFTHTLKAPILANLTEFGKTPLFTLEDLRSINVHMALYPLSAFRVMNAAANKLYQVLRNEGTQQSLLDTMQTREELYDFLDYYAYEARLTKK
jgi:methylisocitrate lyase